MNANKLLQLKRGGSVIVLMMLTLVILLTVGTSLLSLGMHARVMAARTSTEITARTAADAGLAKALIEMDQKLQVKPWDDTVLPSGTDQVLPNSNATFSYEVTKDSNDVYYAESTGRCADLVRTVSCALPLEGLFEYALYMQSNIILKSGSTISGYNYDGGRKLEICTTSTVPGSIQSKTGVTIDGDVVVGVGGDTDAVIDSKTEAVITGETYPSLLDPYMPSVTVPTALNSLPSQGVMKGSVTITNSGKYDSMDLNFGESVLVDGVVSLYIIGDIRLKNSAEFQVVDANTNPDASLILYVGGDILSDNGCIINNLTGSPKKFQIFGLDTCQTIDLKSSVDFYGTIYAPQADVIFYNSVDIYGSVIAKSFEQKTASNFYYDASLRQVSEDDVGVHFVVSQWGEQ